MLLAGDRMDCPQMNPIWRQDRRIGILSLIMWGGTVVKVFPLLSPVENLQSFSALVFMFVLVVAWPTWHADTYMQWRIPVLAFLRTYLIALPFNFSTAVFDAIAPAAAQGRLAVVANVFQLCMAIRIALLTFTSLGWRLPLRLHMLMQAVNIGIFVRYGLRPYCQSKFLSTPELQQTAAAVHNLMAWSTRLFANVTVAVPEGDDAQRAAFVLFCWFVLGWILPTVVLMMGTDEQQQQQQQQPWAQWRSWPGRWLLRAAWWLLQRAGGLLESWLRMLKSPNAASDAGDAAGFEWEEAEEGDGLLYRAAWWALQWWVMLLGTWRLSCFAATALQ